MRRWPAPTRDRHSHFDSKVEVEQAIRRSGVPFTIVAPVFFMENFLADWMAAGIARGSIAMALPATRRLQQIAVADIAQFTALVIERRESFLGKRIDIASDELTSATAAATISEASGRRIEYTAFDRRSASAERRSRAHVRVVRRVGYDADIVGLRSLYPEVECTASAPGSRAGLVSHHRPATPVYPTMRCSREASDDSQSKSPVRGDGDVPPQRRIEEDHWSSCRRRCSVPSRLVFDLTETTLVDLAAVRFLARMKGTASSCCVARIHREWMLGADPRNQGH